MRVSGRMDKVRKEGLLLHQSETETTFLAGWMEWINAVCRLERSGGGGGVLATLI